MSETIFDENTRLRNELAALRQREAAAQAAALEAAARFLEQTYGEDGATAAQNVRALITPDQQSALAARLDAARLEELEAQVINGISGRSLVERVNFVISFVLQREAAAQAAVLHEAIKQVWHGWEVPICELDSSWLAAAIAEKIGKLITPDQQSALAARLDAARLQWTEQERAALDELMQITGLSGHAVLRQGLRVYQLIVKGSHVLTFSDLQKAEEPERVRASREPKERQ